MASLWTSPTGRVHLQTGHRDLACMRSVWSAGGRSHQGEDTEVTCKRCLAIMQRQTRCAGCGRRLQRPRDRQAGAPYHHAQGLCLTCYRRTRPDWPEWLDGCLRCGCDTEGRGYRGYGLCHDCYQQREDPVERRMRYLTARWQGSTLVRSLVYLCRGMGTITVAEAVGVHPSMLRIAADSGEVPMAWAMPLAQLLEDGVDALPPDRQVVSS